jgi:hypothetical protein
MAGPANRHDDSVKQPPDRVDPQALETHVRAVADAAARAAELLRALAPLRARWEALDAAISRATVHPASAPAATAAGRDAIGPAEAIPPGLSTVTVTVRRDDQPLDLTRLHGALVALPGVVSLTLVSYVRGRTVLELHVDQPLDLETLAEALRRAFPEGVTVESRSPDDIAVAIGG